jgi:ketosteroid isomerase-like protein
VPADPDAPVVWHQDTMVIEQEVEGTSSTTGSFVLPNILVLKTRHGQIAHLRDYANLG